MTIGEIRRAIEIVKATLDRLIRLGSDNEKTIMHTRQYLAMLESMID